MAGTSSNSGVTVGVAVVTVLFRTVTPKTAMLRMCCDCVTVVTVHTSANLTREVEKGETGKRAGGA